MTTLPTYEEEAVQLSLIRGAYIPPTQLNRLKYLNGII